MKNFLCVLLLLSCLPTFAFTSLGNSPNNWNNSANNWQNSSNNWNNRPNNWNNPINSPNANIIYDSNGNAKGYAVLKSNGSGVNIYDFNGNRNGCYNY